MFICDKDEQCIDCPKNYPDEQCEHWVEVDYVEHGHWIETIENGKMKRVTSCCGDDQTTLTCWYTPRYCPNCGAKMEKHFREVWKKVDDIKHETD